MQQMLQLPPKWGANGVNLATDDSIRQNSATFILKFHPNLTITFYQQMRTVTSKINFSFFLEKIYIQEIYNRQGR